MRVPISYALHYPERVDVPVAPLDLVELGALTFEPVDEETFACLRLAREAARAGGTAPCTLNAANEVAVHAFLAGRLRFLDIAAVIEETLDALPARSRCTRSTRSATPTREARERGGGADRRAAPRPPEPAPAGHPADRPATLGGRMSYVLAFLGFAALIILHEAGHFAAAKAVGMRVERFSLFFGPMLVKFRRGETEYGIGPIPLGGYVKITGMNPHEEHPARGRRRAPTTTSRCGSGSW